MTWFAFAGLNNGQAIDLAGSQEILAAGEGFHGYATQAQAQANPNAVNLLTRGIADVWIADYKAAVAEHAQPGGANANILNPATAASAAASGVWTTLENDAGLNAVGDFVKGLGQASTWSRVLKVVLGGSLLLMGLARASGAGNAVGNAVKLGAW